MEMRESQNLFHTLDERSFRKRFRLTKTLTERLIRRISPILPDEGPTSSVSKSIQILVTLRFYASGDFQESIGDSKFFGLSQYMVSQIISNVTDAIGSLSDEYIRFPETEEQFQEISNGFQQSGGFPGVLDCIDCTHVIMRSPSIEPWQFKNYKESYSLNIQVTCDHQMRVTSICAYNGRTHDSKIWRESDTKEKMIRVNEEFESRYFLLGDAGYPLCPTLLTPIVDALENTPEGRYTRRHCKTRCTIERVFGAMKGRFRCIHRDRVLAYEPEKVVKFFKNCAILHNYIIENRIASEDVDDVMDQDDDDYNLHQGIMDFDDIVVGQPNSELIRGRHLRQHIIDNFCTD
ncbi:putative nuclease HARBI1 [Fopius arisanus]|uniref:Nuclease HARBI1 n=1 Tax=Fopius arisanus TaxID=64838 RepID=A0A9R1T2Y5_9HYME|nr:PREDICTED: putative nuclease HARBI1 [Fopius arisanus]